MFTGLWGSEDSSALWVLSVAQAEEAVTNRSYGNMSWFLGAKAQTWHSIASTHSLLVKASHKVWYQWSWEISAHGG